MQTQQPCQFPCNWTLVILQPLTEMMCLIGILYWICYSPKHCRQYNQEG